MIEFSFYPIDLLLYLLALFCGYYLGYKAGHSTGIDAESARREREETARVKTAAKGM